MPIVKVWGLPQQSEYQLNQLCNEIIQTILKVHERGFKENTDITVLFPPDSMMEGLGKEILVEITLYARPERTTEALDLMTSRIGTIVHLRYKRARVEVIPYLVDAARCWVSP